MERFFGEDIDAAPGYLKVDADSQIFTLKFRVPIQLSKVSLVGIIDVSTGQAILVACKTLQGRLNGHIAGVFSVPSEHIIDLRPDLKHLLSSATMNDNGSPSETISTSSGSEGYEDALESQDPEQSEIKTHGVQEVSLSWISYMTCQYTPDRRAISFSVNGMVIGML